jgi:uncharacterized protein YdaU (DUF1376 family)
MPWNIGDYRRDTGHLTTLEHGAYLLLIAHYWETGPIRDDDKELAQITLLTRYRWRRIRPTIEQFFQVSVLATSNTLGAEPKQLLSKCWLHKRIDAELKKAENVSLKRKIAGREGGRVSKGKTNIDRFVAQAIAKQTGTQAQRSKKEAAEEAREPSKQDGLGASPILAATIRAKGWG